MADLVGQRFGDYRLIRFLGEGTFGDVYLGEHVYNNARVAVKVFKTKLTPDKLKDFINEVRTILLKHPNIVQLLDFGIGENDVAYLVMEYAPNGTLRQLHPRGTRLPLATIIPYIKQIAAALQYAHDQRRIHRDVKPENMLFGAHHQLLLSDFGIAVVAHNPASQRTEDVIGTARYMAPEQWQRRPLPASDQYALGIIVYEWLCGENPFGGDVLQLMYQHLQVPPPLLREKVPTISPEVEQVVLTALAKDPGRRFASVRAFANVLEQASRPVAPRPPAPTPIPPSPVVIPIANPNPNPKPYATPIPAPSVLESAAPTPSPPASSNKGTIQFEPPPGTAVPSTSQVGGGQSPPSRPVNAPPTAKKAGAGSRVLFIVLAILVVLAAGGGFLGYHSLTLPQPVIQVSSKYQVGSTSAGSTGTSFQVNAQKFPANSPIIFLLDGMPIPGSAGAQSDANGNVRADLAVTNAWSMGNHTLTAKDANNDTTKLGALVVIVPQGEAGTPGPNGAPADTMNFSLNISIQPKDVTTGKTLSSFTQTLAITGQPDPAGGTVCRQPFSSGQQLTMDGTINNGAISYHETYMQTCSGTYKGGKLSYTETITSDQYALPGSVTCTVKMPYVSERLTGTFTSSTAISGTYSSDSITTPCSDNTTVTFNALSGSWTGQSS